MSVHERLAAALRAATEDGGGAAPHGRLLCTTLSYAARGVYAASTSGWNAEMALSRQRRELSLRDGPVGIQPSWCTLLSPLVGCMADEHIVLRSWRELLRLPTVRARHAAPFCLSTRSRRV
jgi:hypothetical protein